MKRKFLPFLFLLIIHFTASAQNWYAVGNPDFSSGLAEYNSMLLSANGTPYIAYADWGNGGKATVMRYTGTDWSPVGGGVISEGASAYTSMAMDKSGNVFVVYQDAAHNYATTLMEFSNNKWTLVGNAGFSIDTANYTSIAIDNNGDPYVAFEDKTNYFKASVMKFSDGDWSYAGKPGFSSGGADHISIAFSPQNIPFVVYQDIICLGKATVQTLSETGWTVVGGHSGFTTGSAEFTRLVFDREGNMYISYSDWGSGGKATVMKYDTIADNWSALGNPDFSDGLAYFTSLIVDNNENFYVAYSDWGNFTGNATMMKYDNSSGDWNVVGSEGFTPGEADFTTMSIDSDGTPYLGFSNGVDGGSTTVVKFSCKPPDVPVVSLQNSMDCGGGSNVISVIKGNLNDAANWVWYEGSENNASVGRGASLSIEVFSSEKYFVRAEGGCAADGNFDSLEINVPEGATYYSDKDEDGFGNPEITLAACVQPAGFVKNDLDCDDNNAKVYPGNPPYNLAASDIQQESAVINWNGTCGATFYQVRYKRDDDSAWITSPDSPSLTSTNLNNLEAGRTYEIQIAGLDANHIVMSPRSEILSFATPGYDYSFLDNLDVKNIKLTSAVMDWNLGSYHSDFRIRYALQGSSSWQTYNTSDLATYQAENLASATTYQWQIQATNGDNYSAWISGPIFTTLQTPILSPSDSNLAGNIVVFPNPAHATFTINMPVHSTHVIITVINILGQIMLTQEVSSLNHELHHPLDAFYWAAGMYIVTVHDGYQETVAKVVIQK